MDINAVISKEFNVKEEYVKNIISFLDEGCTVPFIARYRKESHGTLDDQTIRLIAERLQYLRNLDKRREEIRNSITEQEKMTPELEAAINKAVTLVELEDLYRPFKQKRRTRATIAKEKGLEPLANKIMEQDRTVDPTAEAAQFIDAEKGVNNAEEAVAGALDIIAEAVSDDAALRKNLRNLINAKGSIDVSGDEESDPEGTYRNYYEFSQGVGVIAGHRVLAIDRGEREEKLKVSVTLPEGAGERVTVNAFKKNDSECGKLVESACLDSYKRLIFPSVEREIRNILTEKACESAMGVFSENLRQLLMQPPIKGTVTLGVDPGFRTGCKLAVVDGTGKVLDTGVAHITMGKGASLEQGKRTISGFIKKYNVTAIAIGNGTASRESEQVVSEIIKDFPGVSYMIVSEAGASVYSASKLAAEEFPEYDVSLRSAVSIARRMQDPLAELVKIDPRSIGVGQYQHDMPKARLGEALGGVVEDCVNSVGVDLNTASGSLLTYISGINSGVAKNVVAYREENGAFTDRKQLMKVPKLGAKAFEQCAGFLRIRDGKNPLDNTAVHPESYKAAEEILKLCGFALADIGSEKLVSLNKTAEEIGIGKISEQAGVGVPTVRDILKELAKPGRDPRDELPPPLMRSGDVMELKDLQPGMELMGTVRNITDFGCFVDCGVHEDGLVHISRICNRFIKHPLEAVKVGDVVKVWVVEVDLKRGRLALTMVKEKMDKNIGRSVDKPQSRK
ncbi:MAG: RNA-binding transcriptional accessory protein [Oscillospiraceae bacterium]|nr:RNA-binding transcriptional accessory protein [Oscillospiraceae bacterium]